MGKTVENKSYKKTKLSILESQVEISWEWNPEFSDHIFLSVVSHDNKIYPNLSTYFQDIPAKLFLRSF